MASNTFDDNSSELGMFVPAGANPAHGQSASAARDDSHGGAASDARPKAAQGLVREAQPTATGWGRGPIPVDTRKYRYDRIRAMAAPALPFSATKADRLDAVEAGDKLEAIHQRLGIARENEARVLAFDNALWLDHALNGASMMRPGRGAIVADGVAFDVAPIRDTLGVDARRFFRAFADDIAACLREVLDRYDPYDPASVEVVAQVRQVALERGLQKYPHLAFDAADACNLISMEERTALIASKAHVLQQSVNAVDGIRPRPVATPDVLT